MATHSPSNRAALRAFVVVTLSLLVLMAGSLDLWRIWHPIGVFGYRLNGDEAVTLIRDGFPAAKAGMQVGDTIDLQSTPARYRFYAAAGDTLAPGESITFGLLHKGVRRMVTLTATPQVNEQNEHLYAAYRMAAVAVAILFIILGAALVLLRPSLMTWGFFLFCLGDTPLAFAIAEVLYPFPWPYVFDTTFSQLFGRNANPGTLGIVGLLVFALSFLNDPMKRWRSWAIRLMPWLFVILCGLGTFTFYQQFWIGGPPGQLLNQIALVITALWSLAVLYLFLDTYVHARGEDKQRIRWVVVAFGLNLAIQLVGALLFAGWPGVPLWLLHVIVLSTIIVPLAVTYAVIKHHVIDVSFVVSRTLVYGIVSTVVIGVFVLVEWGAGAWLVSASPTTSAVISIAVALGLGLSMRFLYARVDGFVDAVLFRKQFEARALVARMAAGLPYAVSAEGIADVLTRVACEKLQIASAALFRQHDRGGFQCEATHGWSSGEQLQHSDFQRLSVAFEGSTAPLRLLNFSFAASECLPRGAAAPIVGLPLHLRRQHAGFVLYSGHVDGTDLDPYERGLLVEVAAAASRGYDALELAARVEKANEARARAQAEKIETLKTYNEAYERFVPSEFLKFLDKESIVSVRLGDHVLREMTVLFSDIRSFTSISERMTPEQIFTFLNEYLHRVGPLIRENGGFIDKYIGDAVMGLFPSKPDDALRAAIALQREVRLFNRRLEDEGLPAIAAGVGMHCGALMLGTIGERGRMDTTVIADAVNTASRLETATKLYRCSILLSRQTVEKLSDPDQFMLRSLGSVHVKGKASSVEIYECYDADPAELVLHKRATRERFINAVAAFESGGSAAALQAFTAIVAANEKDGPGAYFLERCSEQIAAI